MTMEDIAKEINCQHIRIEASWYVFPYERNCWFVCRRTGQATDENRCSKCKDRKPRKQNGKRKNAQHG